MSFTNLTGHRAAAFALRLFFVSMRLDNYLKSSRLILRRTLAQQFCEAGLVKVNGAVARSSKEVKAGDEIEITRRDSILTVRITEIPQTKQVAKTSAAELYETVSSVPVERESYF